MPNVLEVEDLRTEFHLRSANVGAVDGISFTVAEGECVGHRRRVRLREEHAGLSIMRLLPGGRPHRPRPDPASTAATSSPMNEKQMQEIRGNEVAMIFQDPMTSLNPTMTLGQQIAEGVRLHRNVSKKEAKERAIEVLSLVGMPRPAERVDYYPHQLSGRPPPAGDDRHGARLRPEASHRRRADDGARRHDPGPDPQPARRPPQPPQDGDHPHHPRHGRHRRPHRPRARHVRRQDRGGRRDRGALPPDAAPLRLRPCSSRSRSSTRTAPSGSTTSPACRRT